MAVFSFLFSVGLGCWCKLFCLFRFSKKIVIEFLTTCSGSNIASYRNCSDVSSLPLLFVYPAFLYYLRWSAFCVLPIHRLPPMSFREVALELRPLCFWMYSVISEEFQLMNLRFTYRNCFVVGVPSFTGVVSKWIGFLFLVIFVFVIVLFSSLLWPGAALSLLLCFRKNSWFFVSVVYLDLFLKENFYLLVFCRLQEVVRVVEFSSLWLLGGMLMFGGTVCCGFALLWHSGKRFLEPVVTIFEWFLLYLSNSR